MSNNQANGIDSYTLQVILTILHIIGNLRHSGMEATSEVELSYPQILILYALVNKEAATITELSQGMKVTQGVVSRMIDRMEEKGMVERSRDQADRRVVTVRLSVEGRKHALSMIDLHLDSIKQQLLKIPSRDRDTFLDVLKSIDRELEENDRSDR
jgi:DNA-binding MarR family transcriptional regulator